MVIGWDFVSYFKWFIMVSIFLFNEHDWNLLPVSYLTLPLLVTLALTWPV